MKRTIPASLAMLILVASAPIVAQQVFDPFATPPPPNRALSDGPSDAAPSQSSETAAPVERPSIGFTWWNDGPALVREGNAAYHDGRFEEAELWYQDARLAMDRVPAAVDFNQGLALSKQGRWIEAISAFNMALDRAGADAELRGDIFYNRGTTRLSQAQQAAVEMLATERSGRLNRQQIQALNAKRNETVQALLQSIDDLSLALERRADWDDARYNRAQAQHLLARLTREPPPPSDQQQQQQDSGDQQNQEQEGQQDGDSSQNQQPGGDQDQEQGDQQQEQNPQGGDQQDQQDQQNSNESSGEEDETDEQDSQDSQGSQGGTQSQRATQMTPEEAAALLELINADERIQLRQRRTQTDRPRPARDW